MIIDLDDWTKLPTQEKVYYDDKSKTIMLSSGLGMGKTHLLCRKALKLTAYNRGHPGGILAPTYSDYKRDIEPELEIILQDKLGLIEGEHYWYNRSAKEWKFCWNKKPMYVFTGERAIAGPNLAWCAINEFSLIKYERVNEMMRRVRIKDAPLSQKLLVGTPEDVHGWLPDFQTQMLENKTENFFKLYNADTAENTFIDDDYRNYLKSTLDEYQYEIFVKGIFSNAHPDKVYYSFKPDIHVREFETKIVGSTLIGEDFNINPGTASLSYVDNETLYVYDEVYELHSNTYKMAEAMKRKVHPADALIIPDSTGKALRTSSAGVSDHDILRSAGFKIAQVHNPFVGDRYNTVNGLFHNNRIVIHPRCKMLIKDLTHLKRDNKNEMLSHCSDGLGYICYYLWPLRPQLVAKRRDY